MYDYRVIRSDRRTAAIQITRDGEVLVRCPRRMPEAEIRRLVADKSAWIERHLNVLTEPDAPVLTAGELDALKRQAREALPARAAHFAPLAGVTYGNITIRSQKSRWGSCSNRGNLSFNCLLMLAPSEVLDYVVVHELCHRLEMNHSPRFWAEVERVLPDYRVRRKWLKDHGGALLRRLQAASGGCDDGETENRVI